jgi:hypothetical protein
MLPKCLKLFGRGKRIRTSGPCLPKQAASAQNRRNAYFLVAGHVERAENIAESDGKNTGAAPGQFCRLQRLLMVRELPQ